jgi:hypothetical protein
MGKDIQYFPPNEIQIPASSADHANRTTYSSGGG